MDKKAQTVATYNATAARMAEKFNTIGARTEDIARAFSYVDVKNPRVLEIGCGNGRDAQEILAHTNEYLGIDISESMIELAQAYAPTGAFAVADIETYTFPQDLDVIFSFASLLHSPWEQVRDVLARAHAALKPKGVFYLSLKHAPYHEETKTDEFGTRTYYFYTPEDIEVCTAGLYETVFKEVQELRGQEWFTMLLRKIN